MEARTVRALACPSGASTTCGSWGWVVGIAVLLIGFWAAGSPRRSVGPLIIRVGAAAPAPGFMEITLALRLRGLRQAVA